MNLWRGRVFGTRARFGCGFRKRLVCYVVAMGSGRMMRYVEGEDSKEHECDCSKADELSGAGRKARVLVTSWVSASIHGRGIRTCYLRCAISSAERRGTFAFD